MPSMPDISGSMFWVSRIVGAEASSCNFHEALVADNENKYNIVIIVLKLHFSSCAIGESET